MSEFDFISLFKCQLRDHPPNWYVKGLLDFDNTIITLGTDSKLIGRIFELKCNPILQKIAAENPGYTLHKPSVQTEYPDFYYQCPNGKKIAVDIKTTYLDPDNRKFDIKYTLGSYTSFLQDGKKNKCGNYSEYIAHYIIGFVYDRNSDEDGITIPYSSPEANTIVCPYKNVQIWVQQKYLVVGENEGSGNTANIGSITTRSITRFETGNGPFSVLGKEICDDYWKTYKNQKHASIIEYLLWAPSNSNLKDIDFESKKNDFLHWKFNNDPTDEVKIMLAKNIYLLKGPRGGKSGFEIHYENGEIERILRYSQAFIKLCQKHHVQIHEK